ncbi:MAG: hypothetical protein JXN64_11055 [Spirochaetes bacterium]|nr:hypothetical protein [Spirochaetota bacterium]
MAQRLRKHINFASVLLLALVLADNTASAVNPNPDEESYTEIKRLFESDRKEQLVNASKQFLRKYPKSNLVADVRFIMAESEADPQKAVAQFKILVDKYAYFKKRDLSQYRICEILYLQSKWSDLKQEAEKGIRLFKNSGYLTKFKFYLAKALIHLEQFEAAKKVCIDITRTDHGYNNLSEALILLSYINRSMYGISRSYLYSLSEIIAGFRNSENMPAALYLLGRYYRSKGDYDKAYSAYSDVAAKYPRSPEAEFSRKELSAIAQHNPSKTAYIPDKETIKKTDSIDIQPETDMEGMEGSGENNYSEKAIQYSISLGPFDTIQNARNIKKLIDKDFNPVEIAEVRSGFYIYAGRYSGIDPAFKTKVRLAEEFGINGSIVKIIKDGNKIYVYEE